MSHLSFFLWFDNTVIEVYWSTAKDKPVITNLKSEQFDTNWQLGLNVEMTFWWLLVNLILENLSCRWRGNKNENWCQLFQERNQVCHHLAVTWLLHLYLSDYENCISVILLKCISPNFSKKEAKFATWPVTRLGCLAAKFVSPPRQCWQTFQHNFVQKHVSHDKNEKHWHKQNNVNRFPDPNMLIFLHVSSRDENKGEVALLGSLNNLTLPNNKVCVN